MGFILSEKYELSSEIYLAYNCKRRKLSLNVWTHSCLIRGEILILHVFWPLSKNSCFDQTNERKSRLRAAILEFCIGESVKRSRFERELSG